MQCVINRPPGPKSQQIDGAFPVRQFFVIVCVLWHDDVSFNYPLTRFRETGVCSKQQKLKTTS